MSHVFVVEDDNEVRSALQWMLEGADVQGVRTFPSAEAFLECVRPEDSGVLLLDLVLPGMSGLELLERHLRTSFDLRVLLLTGHGTIPLAVRAMALGAVDVVEKPVDGPSLLAKVREHRTAAEARSSWSAERSDLRVRLAELTAREREILGLVVEGKTSRMIAEALGISRRTVEVHRFRILEKTATDNVTDLLPRLAQLRLLDEVIEPAVGHPGAAR